MRRVIMLMIFLTSSQAYSEEIIRINVSSKHSSYSKKEPQYRVYQLEKAVWQLQRKIAKKSEKMVFSAKTQNVRNSLI